MDINLIKFFVHNCLHALMHVARGRYGFFFAMFSVFFIYFLCDELNLEKQKVLTQKQKQITVNS